MARARNIKPGFFENDLLAQCSPHARLLFIGLWTLADRRGILENRPARIKAAILPYENVKINRLISELESRGFIKSYENAGVSAIIIPTFLRHQNPHRDERPSDVPAPYEHSASTVLAPEPHHSAPADSLNTDSLNTDSLNTDSLHSPESGEDHPPGDSPKPVKRSAKPDLTGFADWYDRYPLKVSRADAERAWSKLSPGDRQAALDGLLVQQHWPTMQRGYEYLKHPATWLNKRCWEDESPPIPASLPGRPRMPLPNGWDYDDVHEWRARKQIGARITPEKERLLEQIDAYERGESPEQPGSGASSSGLAAD